MEREEVYHNPNGMFYWKSSPYIDWEGNPVERTKHTHPYSYDAYVQHKVKDKYQQAVYDDRMQQWDAKKYEEAMKNNFKSGEWWHNRTPEKVEGFLRDYYDKPDLKLVGIMEGCNESSGYPYWVFMFDCNFKMKSLKKKKKISKCNCGKKATSTWVIVSTSLIHSSREQYKSAREISFCDYCKPSRSTDTIYQI